MGVKDGFMGASLFMKIAFILLLFANLFSWIAFTTTSWGYDSTSVNSYRGNGLWRVCGEGLPCGLADGTRLEWFGAFQAFGIFGFVSLSVALLLVILYMFVGSCRGNGEVKMAAFILCFVGGICWLIAVIIYASKYKKITTGDPELGFSFALAIIALIAAVVAGILIVIEGKVGGGTSPA